jgi:hypothetical protein
VPAPGAGFIPDAKPPPERREDTRTLPAAVYARVRKNPNVKEPKNQMNSKRQMSKNQKARPVAFWLLPFGL